MEATIDWDKALESMDVMDLPALSLLRNISDVFGGSVSGEVYNESDLFAALQAADEKPESPGAVSYASSDDTSSEVRSEEHSHSSSDFGEKTKKRVHRKRNTAGMTAQEKRDLRKLRNRELAAESRKRKNDEMDRLRSENNELKKRITELEKQLAATGVVAVNGKRTRLGTTSTVATSIAASSMALFVLTGPAESPAGVGGTASVLITALDSFDGQMAAFARFFFTAFIAMMLILLMGLFASTRASVPSKFSSMAKSIFPRQRTNSLIISRAV